MSNQRGRSTTKKSNRSTRSEAPILSRKSISVKPKKNNNRKMEKDTQTSLGRTDDYSNPIGNMNGNSFRVRKREFIQNIVPTDPFTPLAIEFNPGLKSCFPWLSGVAVNFEKYVIKKLSFCYETAQSTFVPGMVMMAPEFNVSDPPPSTKTELLEYAYACRAPVWKNFKMNIPERMIMSYRDYYVRAVAVTDRKLYDPLYIIVATDAVSTELNYCGELWIEYEVEFTLPQIMNRDLVSVFNTKIFNFGLTSNTTPFANLVSQKYDLDVVILSSSVLQFQSDFTGIIDVVVDATNIGVQTKMHLNPANWNVSDGQILYPNLIGGSNAAADTNGWDHIQIYVKVPAMTKVYVNNLGYYDTGLIAQGSIVKITRTLWY